MKIASSNYPLAAPQNGTRRTTNNSDANNSVDSVQSALPTGEQTSSVNISSMSALHSSSDSDIDTAKVEAVKAALRDGTYQIDSGKIADGMLSTARDLLQKTAR